MTRIKYEDSDDDDEYYLVWIQSFLDYYLKKQLLNDDRQIYDKIFFCSIYLNILQKDFTTDHFLGNIYLLSCHDEFLNLLIQFDSSFLSLSSNVPARMILVVFSTVVIWSTAWLMSLWIESKITIQLIFNIYLLCCSPET
jgi:hypothetical protein